MSDLIAKATAALEDLEARGQLPAYAAKAAAQELVENWKAAVRDGHPDPDNLIEDVDDTIKELQTFKSGCLPPATSPVSKVRSSIAQDIRHQNGLDD